MCGENQQVLLTGLPRWGSSPRVRGKPHARRVGPRLHGLIPACAGKTADPEAKRLARTAHPRVCGENLIRQPEAGRPRGSSPRVRGKRRGRVRVEAPSRLIPACAGKTLSLLLLRTACRAHPRVCGENGHEEIMQIPSLGSSPRVRGKRPKRDPYTLPGGLIPACAGKTPPHC